MGNLRTGNYIDYRHDTVWFSEKYDLKLDVNRGTTITAALPLHGSKSGLERANVIGPNGSRAIWNVARNHSVGADSTAST